MRRIGWPCCWIVSLVLLNPAAHATWSIVIGDCQTKEVAVGTVTCLNNFDLHAIVPAVVVGKGAGAVQAWPDGACSSRSAVYGDSWHSRAVRASR